jgi:ribulose-phosphate 3-epimerase
VTVHAEATRHLHETLRELTELVSGAPVVRGVAINPGTPVDAVEPVLDLVDLVLVLAVNPGFPSQPPAANTAARVARVRRLADASGCPVMVGIDGGVKLANAARVASWGADVIVSGSAIFNGGDVPANLAAMRAAIADGQHRKNG